MPARHKAQPARVLAGVMSGTSADGADVVLVAIAPDWSWQLLSFYHAGYSRRQRAAILQLAGGQGSIAQLAQLHVDLGRRLGEAVREAVRRTPGLPPLAAIASHGQTVYHQGRRASLQLGEPATLAAVAGAAVISDFRAADIAAGGEGAPLVPWVDWRLFTHPRRYRAALNLGGIANLTLLPPAARAQAVRGFDTGPANMALDAYMLQLSQGRRGFDRGGRLARAGQVAPGLLAALARHPFFRRPPPKSAGREQFGADFVASALTLYPRLAPADVMATLVALTAAAVAAGLRRGGKRALQAEVIVSGGGVKNPALLAALAQAAPGCCWLRSDDLGVPAQAKEALAFALLGEAHLRGQAANLPAVTGARRAVVLGSYTPAPKSK